MPISDDDLDAQLTQAARLVPELEQAFALSIVQQAAAPARRKKRWRGVWTVTAAIATVGALALPTAAIAERLFAAQTGIIDDGYGTETLEGDEWIATDAPDYKEYVASVAPRFLPSPKGFDWDAEAATIASWYDGNFGSIQRITLVSSLERSLWLGWILEWIEADQAHDDARREAAMSVLRETPTWRGTASSDGGGVRYFMWAYLARMNSAQPEERSEAAQALLQQEVVDLAWAQHHAITGELMGHTIPADLADLEDQIATYGPSSRNLYIVWDRIDRRALIDEVYNEFRAMSDETDASLGSPYWDDYDRALVEVAEAAGVTDPSAAVGRRGWGHQDDSEVSG